MYLADPRLNYPRNAVITLIPKAASKSICIYKLNESVYNKIGNTNIDSDSNIYKYGITVNSQPANLIMDQMAWLIKSYPFRHVRSNSHFQRVTTIA